MAARTENIRDDVKRFIDELRKTLKPEIEIEQLDCHLEDSHFALALVENLIELHGGMENK